MLSNNNLSQEASTLTKWLVSIPSVAHAKGPALICQAIHDGLVEFPYFKKNKDKLHLIEHQDSNKSSVIALVKAMEEVSQTIVLLCDTDTASPYHYGMLKGYSTNCDELLSRLKELDELNDSKVKEGIANDDLLFGLGVLQSKCATGSMLVALKELSDNYVRLNVNVLFICTSESAIQHRGIKKCIPFIQELIDREKLTLRLAINAKPNFPLFRKDQDLHIFTGNYGKVEPSFYIIGNSAASFKPYSGFSASIIASELIRELELNAKLTQKLHNSPLVPTFDSLRVKEFGKEYSPDGMQISFSMPIVNLDLNDLLEILKEAAAKAIENASDLVDQREAMYAHINQEDFTPQVQDAEVVSFSDLLERASHNFTGNLHKALHGMVQKCRSEGLSLHQASITIIERLNELAKLPRPSVVVYFTDNFLPPQGLSASLSQDRELFMILDDLLSRFNKLSPIAPTLATYYAPTDACLLRPIGLQKSLSTLRQECPVGVEDIEGLNVPTITLGVKGDNLTLLTEYVEKSMFEYLPSLVVSIVDAIGENPVGAFLQAHQDLQLQLEQLAEKAESISAAVVNESREISEEQQGEGFYSKLSQGKLEPESLEHFLQQQQAANNGKTDAKLSLKNVKPAALQSPETFAAEHNKTTAPDALVNTASVLHTKSQAHTEEEVSASIDEQLAQQDLVKNADKLQEQENQKVIESHIDRVLDVAHHSQEVEHTQDVGNTQNDTDANNSDLLNAIAQSINDDAKLNSEIATTEPSPILEPSKVEIAGVIKEEQSALGQIKSLFKKDSTTPAPSQATATTNAETETDSNSTLENTAQNLESTTEQENETSVPEQDKEHDSSTVLTDTQDNAQQSQALESYTKAETETDSNSSFENTAPALESTTEQENEAPVPEQDKEQDSSTVLTDTQDNAQQDQALEKSPETDSTQVSENNLNADHAQDNVAKELDNIFAEKAELEAPAHSEDHLSDINGDINAKTSQSIDHIESHEGELNNSKVQYIESFEPKIINAKKQPSQDAHELELDKNDKQLTSLPVSEPSKANSSSKDSTSTHEEAKSSPFAIVSSFFKSFKRNKGQEKSDHSAHTTAMKTPLGVEDEVDWLNTPELAQGKQDKSVSDQDKELSIENIKSDITNTQDKDQLQLDLSEQDKNQELNKDIADLKSTDKSPANDDQNIGVSSEQVADLLLTSIKNKLQTNSLASLDDPKDYQQNDIPLNNNVYATDIALGEVEITKDKLPLETKSSFNTVVSDSPEAERIAAEKAEQERLEAARIEAERIAAEKAEQERLEAERIEAERIAAEKAEQERLEAERLEAERIAAEKAEQERLEAERIEAERIAAEKAEQERLEAERLEAERIAAEKAEQERLEAERLEAERIAAEKAEQERLEAERIEAERIAAEKAEQERLEAERIEAERIAAEKAEQERLEAERIAAEKAEQERLEAERLESERIAAEKAEQERLETERLESERIAAEKAEQERLEAERIAAEKKAKEERLEAEPKSTAKKSKQKNVSDSSKADNKANSKAAKNKDQSSGAESKKLSRLEELTIRLAAMRAGEDEATLKDKLNKQQEQFEQEKSAKSNASVSLPSNMDLTKAIDSNVTMLSKKAFFISEDPHNTRNPDEVFAEAEAEAAAKRAEAQKRLKTLSEALAKEKEQELAAQKQPAIEQQQEQLDKQIKDADTANKVDSSAKDNKTEGQINKPDLAALNKLIENAKAEAKLAQAETKADTGTAAPSEVKADTEVTAKVDTDTAATADVKAETEVAAKVDTDTAATAEVKAETEVAAKVATDTAATTEVKVDAEVAAKDDIGTAATAQVNADAEVATEVTAKDSLEGEYPSVGISSESADDVKADVEAKAEAVIQAEVDASDENIFAEPVLAPGLDEPEFEFNLATDEPLAPQINSYENNLAPSVLEVQAEDVPSIKTKSDIDYDTVTEVEVTEVISPAPVKANINIQEAKIVSHSNNDRSFEVEPLDEATVKEIASLRKVGTEEAIAELLYANEDFSEEADLKASTNTLEARRAALRRAMFGDDSSGQETKPKANTKRGSYVNLDDYKQPVYVPNQVNHSPEDEANLTPTRVVGSATTFPSEPPKEDSIKQNSYPHNKMEPVASSSAGVRILRTPNSDLRKALRDKRAAPTFSTAIVGKREPVETEAQEAPVHSIGIVGKLESHEKEQQEAPKFSTAIVGKLESHEKEQPQAPTHSIGIVGKLESHEKEQQEAPKFSTAIVGKLESQEKEPEQAPEHSIGIVGKLESHEKEQQEAPKFSTAIVGKLESHEKEPEQAPAHSIGIVGKLESHEKEQQEAPKFSTAIVGKREPVDTEVKEAPKFSTAIEGSRKSSPQPEQHSETNSENEEFDPNAPKTVVVRSKS